MLDGIYFHYSLDQKWACRQLTDKPKMSCVHGQPWTRGGTRMHRPSLTSLTCLHSPAYI